MAKKKSSARAEKNYQPGNRKNLELDGPSDSRGYMSGKDVTWLGDPADEHISKFLKDMGLIESILTRILAEKDIIAIGQCFPFAYEMAQKWWSDHVDRTKHRGEGIHPDLDDKSKFKVVHGTVTNKWHDPPKAVVHAWVEMGDMIFDDQTKATKPNGVPRDVYYDMFQPEIRNEYTAEEVVMKCTRTGSPGPWDEESLGSMRIRDAWLNDGLLRENVDISINGIPLNVELASDNAGRAQGLMHRSQLLTDGGMLFAFPDQDSRSFWMRNTPVPLSIAYADAEGKIINIEDMEPYSEVGVRSTAPATYALEMNRGWFNQNGVTPGHLLDGVVGLQCESSIRSLVTEQTRLLKEELEMKEILRDVVKGALGAGAIAATGGAGGDTVVDIIFAVDASKEVLDAVDSAINSAGEIQQAMQTAMATNISNGPDAIYDAVEGIVISIAESSEFGADTIGAMADAISSLLNKLVGAVGDWIGTALPDDAGLGGALIREAMEGVIAELGENVFEILKAAFDALPQKAQDFISSPQEMAAFLNEIADKIVEFLDGAETEEEEGEESTMFDKAKAAAGTVADVAGTVANPAGAVVGAVVKKKAKEFLDGPFRDMIPTATQILNKLITAFFGGVALAQVLAKWDSEGGPPEEEGKPEEGKSAVKVKEEALLRECIRQLLKEDPMGFVHDLAATSDEFGQEGEMFFGGHPGKGGAKAIKRAFNANADHQFLSTLDTVHWGDPYDLEQLFGANKDELSTTMTPPGDEFLPYSSSRTGLWVKGRITLAANSQDALYTGMHFEYRPGTDEEEIKKYLHRKDSSGINKLPTVSKDYSRYSNLEKGNKGHERMARQSIPYVLDASTFEEPHSGNPNEALVDNWRPVGVIAVGDLPESVEHFADRDWAVEATGITRQMFRLAQKFGVPIYDWERNKLWSPK